MFLCVVIKMKECVYKLNRSSFISLSIVRLVKTSRFNIRQKLLLSDYFEVLH